MYHQMIHPSARLDGLMATFSQMGAGLETRFYGMSSKALRELPMARDIQWMNRLVKSTSLGRQIELAQKMAEVGRLAMPSDEEILDALIQQDRDTVQRAPTPLGDILPAILRAWAWRSIQNWRRKSADLSLSQSERYQAGAEADALIATCRRHKLLEMT